jgi:hypothetical protein
VGSRLTKQTRLCRSTIDGDIAGHAELSMFKTMFAVSPAGTVTRPLWRYYLVEIPRAFGPRALGPGGESNVLVVAALHVGLSALGGALALAVGWMIHKRRPA